MRRYRRGHDRRVDLWALATFCVRFAFFKQWVTSSRFQQKKHPSVTKADDIQNRDLANSGEDGASTTSLFRIVIPKKRVCIDICNSICTDASKEKVPINFITANSKIKQIQESKTNQLKSHSPLRSPSEEITSNSSLLTSIRSVFHLETLAILQPTHLKTPTSSPPNAYSSCCPFLSSRTLI